jgi:hypothetical protein
MAEPVQPTPEPDEGNWTAAQVKALLDSEIAKVRRDVEIAREAQPPHVTIQDYFEKVETLRDRFEDKMTALRDRYEDKLTIEREKGIQLALSAANALERERIGRMSDLIACERRVNDIVREMSDKAISKAEVAAENEFAAVRQQLDAMRVAVQALAGRVDQAFGGDS